MKMKVTHILSLVVAALFVSAISFFTQRENKGEETKIQKIQFSPEMAAVTTSDSAKENSSAAQVDKEIDHINKELIALEDEVDVVHDEAITSYYHDKFNGKRTASGALFSNKKLTAAHKTLPFGTKVRVTNLSNEESVVVTINDRGPFTKGRSLDLSKKAFMDITHKKAHGTLKVKVEILPENYEETRAELVEDLEGLVQVNHQNLEEFAL